MFGNANPLSFLTAAKAHDAELLIGQTELLVASLGPTPIGLKPAAEALAAAKALYTARDFAKAVAQAKRAAALASSLNERFAAYLTEWKALQACREELEGFGFPTEVLNDALRSADKEVVHQVEEGGTVVPNYLGATAMLERAMEEARTLVARARTAAREIFLATLAVEALSESSSTQTPSWLAIRLDRMIEQATRELALGKIPEAHRIASEAKTRADDARAGAARAWELVDMAAAILDGLGAEGKIAEGLTRKMESARDALARGFPDRASALDAARHLSDEVAFFARHYPKARRILERAERVYARLQQEGFCSYDVDAALSEARHAFERGDWVAVRVKVRHASRSFVRLRDDQDALTRAISDVDERVALLQCFRLPLLPDVQEILGRAKEEVRSGRLSGAHEDLLLARSLMTQATRSGS